MPHKPDSCFLRIMAAYSLDTAREGAEALVNMYFRWADQHGHKVRILWINEEPIGGFKDAWLHVEGDGVNAFLDGERGLHRFVKTRAELPGGLYRGGLVGVYVYPESEVARGKIKIVFDQPRSTPPGGQKTMGADPSVRAVALDEFIGTDDASVICESERSQHKNRDLAERALISIISRDYFTADGDIKKDPPESLETIRSYVSGDNPVIEDHMRGVLVEDAGDVLNGDLSRIRSPE